MPLKTYVYIDGFNLYYGCLKESPYKWLDLSKLCKCLLPKNDVETIRYFTARITPRLKDPHQSQRQDVYLRALRTLPKITIHTGHFLTNPKWRMEVNSLKKVQVWETEEKGSDVNLASHLLIDAFESKYDVAVIVSNDSDLRFPIEYVKKRLGKIIGILNPHSKNPSHELKSLANFYKPIRKNVLQVSQFPEHLKDFQGTFLKPQSW